jgi:hypothetical protein
MRILRNILPALAAASVFVLAVSGAAFAQDAPPVVDPSAQGAQNPQTDPPGRVARLNFAQGPVSFLPAGGGQNDWIAGSTNRPVTIGDKIWVDTGGQAELHIGSTAIRMGQSTGISFLNLNDSSVQIQFTDGSLQIHLRHLAPNEIYEVDTPNLAFTTQTAGVYRIDTNTDGNRTVVTVREGQGQVTGGGRSYNVATDQQAVFTGTDTLEYDLLDADAQPMNDFDRWAADRDHKEDHLGSVAYVSPDMTGVEDLDAYGAWSNVPEYGNVWYPTTVAVGWAPYRFGHWVYVAPWGWTWVGDEPWAFAPFHYGRWAFFGGRWGWVPGPLGPRPYYAPALVAWVGGGPGFGVSVGFGAGIGWFPLGPREVFVPYYHVSTVYVTRVNVTNTIVDRTTVINTYNNVNVRNTYVNQHVAGGVTAVSHEAFVGGQPVARNTVQISERDAASAQVVRQPQAAPTGASFRGGATVVATRPPATVMNRPVVAKQIPPNNQNGNGFFRPSNNNSRPPNAPAPGNTGNASRGEQPPQPTPQVNPTPQVKPAPQVKPPTPQQKAAEDAKQKKWEDAHPRPPKKDGKGQ